MISYSEVLRYYAANKKGYEDVLRGLEDRLISGREEKDIPIYLTKYRVKKVDDIYLKTKRKSVARLDELTDFAGLRVLCLYTEDLFVVHQFIVEVLLHDKFEVRDVRIYNFFKDDRNVIHAIQRVTEGYSGVNPRIEEKQSGYRSIHYIIKESVKGHVVEIQLRTLFQDVWGELEHNLAYKKGNINPYIRKSFQLLASNINNNDELISHLKTIRKRDKITEIHENTKLTSRKVFRYEPNKVPDFFVDNSELKNNYETYTNYVESMDLRELQDSGIATADELYKIVLAGVTADKLYDGVRYWVEMEKAFLLYCKCKYEEALEIYKAMSTQYPNSYVIPFRIGEIMMLLKHEESDKVQALTYFDMAEDAIRNYKPADEKNVYLIKSMLAVTYWSFGSEFFNVAIEKINEAQDIYDNNPTMLSETERCMLINNMCYYHLENYIYRKDMDKRKASESYEIAKCNFLKLKPVLNEEYCNSNMLDTAAWFCYYAANAGEDYGEYMTLAKDYCQRALKMKKMAQFTFRSFTTHMNHFQSIMGDTLLSIPSTCSSS